MKPEPPLSSPIHSTQRQASNEMVKERGKGLHYKDRAAKSKQEGKEGEDKQVAYLNGFRKLLVHENIGREGN